ncbi:MAG: T9SS type A sorting domain-containing protein [candidate division Zixibacteria bacterium]|nr:T9SS type A sorting domain-containing protein [Candidatus Tariuqbacter arcticus]
MKRLIIILTVCSFLGGTVIAGELSFAGFQYITAYEQTIFGERISFYNGDTLRGWLHSNDIIQLMQCSSIYGPITSSADSFSVPPGCNIIFNYPEADFPEELSTIREAAMLQGRFYSYPGYQFRMLFQGSQGSILYKWPIGLPFSDTLATVVAQMPPLIDGAVFVNGRLEMLATNPELQIDNGISGRITVGASGDIWLMDNLRYIDSDPVTGAVDSSTTNCLGVASEGNILVANTFENGRDNGGIYSNDPWRSSIIINGAILVSGGPFESFSFEDQNDVLTAYGGTLPEWYYSQGPYPDERGQIHLWGALAQYRRGYVHRSNHGGTGYLKDYHYYYGLSEDPPPYFPYLPIEMSFNPDTVDFGIVNIGSTGYEGLVLYNVSMDSIDILSYFFSDPAFSGVSEGDSLFCPNDWGSMIIAFQPSIPGEYEEVLTFHTDQGDFPVVLLSEVTGARIGDEHPPNCLEHFQFIAAKPNPFNSRVALEFYSAQPGEFRLTIFDINGREVYFYRNTAAIGLNSVYWQPSLQSSGVYLYKIESAETAHTGKLIYLR